MSDDSTAIAEPQLLKIDVTVEETSTCQRKVKVSVPREEIDRYYEEAVGDLMPTALLPGFRPGRAPRKLVGSKFKTELNDQIRSKLLNDALERVNEQENLAPVNFNSAHACMTAVGLISVNFIPGMFERRGGNGKTSESSHC